MENALEHKIALATLDGQGLSVTKVSLQAK